MKLAFAIVFHLFKPLNQGLAQLEALWNEQLGAQEFQYFPKCRPLPSLPLCHCSVLDNSFSFFSFTFQLVPFGSTVPFFLAPRLKKKLPIYSGFPVIPEASSPHTYLGLLQFLFPIKFTPPLTSLKELHSTRAHTNSSLLCNIFYIFFICFSL